MTTLSEVVDDTLAWFSLWHRLAFMDRRSRELQAEDLSAPQSFKAWLEKAPLPGNQYALEKLAAIHDQLHQTARLVLLKTKSGKSPSAADYEAVLIKYTAFLFGIRQLEQMISAAASGLDNLTGLRSRVGMFEDLAREAGRYIRNDKGFCLAMMDVDRFKEINDTHGHEAGDRVLVAVANHIGRNLRVFDDAYRFGGEEFLLCLKETDLETGLKIVERLRQSLSSTPVLIEPDQAIRVTASFGIVASDKLLTLDGLIKRADDALYRAKHEGRNRVVAG
jgi:diguanylate cyclase (GGDEF)-like protein